MSLFPSVIDGNGLRFRSEVFVDKLAVSIYPQLSNWRPTASFGGRSIRLSSQLILAGLPLHGLFDVFFFRLLFPISWPA